MSDAAILVPKTVTIICYMLLFGCLINYLTHRIVSNIVYTLVTDI